MNRTRTLPILLVVAIMATLLVPVAHAEPDTSTLESLQRQLRSLESQVAEQRSEVRELDARESSLSAEQVVAQARLEEIEAELSEAVEVYNEAVVALEEVQADLAATAAELEELAAEIAVLSGTVVDHARRLHKMGPSIEFAVFLGASGPADIGFRSTSLRQIIATDQAGIERLDAATDRAAALEARLEQQEAAATQLAEQVEAELLAVEALHERHADELATLEATLTELRSTVQAEQAQLADDEAELSDLRGRVDAEQQRVEDERARLARQRERAAEERRQQQAAAQRRQEQAASNAASSSSSNTSSSSSSGSSTSTAAPAPSTRRSADVAVSTALAQVGKPYQWGAGGPGSFDCSGLTSYAWRAAGVTIPRTSRAQFSGLRKVTRAQLQPGDLVFYNSPISHVAMYVGGDTIVEASRTGIPVRTARLSNRVPVGYARP